jgi:excinuclease ABC subunit C
LPAPSSPSPPPRARLLKELGGVGPVKKASLETLKALPWLPDRVAEAVYEKLHGS